MKIEFEKQFGKGVDPWYAKAERWAKKQRFPISFLALGLIEWLKQACAGGSVTGAVHPTNINGSIINLFIFPINL